MRIAHISSKKQNEPNNKNSNKGTEKKILCLTLSIHVSFEFEIHKFSCLVHSQRMNDVIGAHSTVSFSPSKQSFGWVMYGIYCVYLCIYVKSACHTHMYSSRTCIEFFKGRIFVGNRKPTTWKTPYLQILWKPKRWHQSWV